MDKIVLRRGLKRVRNYGKRNGFFSLLKVSALIIDDIVFDLFNGVDTISQLTFNDINLNKPNKEHGVSYMPSHGFVIGKVINSIKINPKESVFVDFGCGKGKPLLYALKAGFREVRGIEFSEQLCEVAKKNVLNFQSTKEKKFSIICSDVVEYIIRTDENVFFLNNPFDKVIIAKVLSNIKASLKEKPREICVIYYHPKCGDLELFCDFLFTESVYKILTKKVILYRNKINNN